MSLTRQNLLSARIETLVLCGCPCAVVRDMHVLSFFQRIATPDMPAGWTVTKSQKLPEGDFHITEYQWGDTSLCFVDQDEFTEDERQAAYEAFIGS